MKKWLIFLSMLLLAVNVLPNKRTKSAGDMPSDTAIIFNPSPTPNTALKDSVHYRKKEKPPVKAWKLIDEFLGFVDTIPVDTIIVNSQNNEPISKNYLEASYNGNLGSPIQSKIYFDRTQKTDFLFSNAYDLYTVTPKDISFYNTKTPFTYLTYRTGGASYHEEDYIKGLFTLNINKNLNLGLFADYIYARGTYANQASKMLSAGGFGCYTGKHYQAQGALLFNRFNNKENGGITDSRFITYPATVSASNIEASNIPTNLNNAYNRYFNDIYYYNHKYRIGREKEIQITNDSVGYEFIPIMSFIHTIQFEEARRRYYENGTPNAEFYKKNYISDNYTNDSTSYLSLKNRLAVTLEEKFNSLMRFGVTAYAEHEWQRHEFFIDTVPTRIYDNNIKIGGYIYKHEGSIIHYRAGGDVTIAGDRIGDFRVTGNIKTGFKIGKADSMKISAYAKLQNEKPTYFLRDYISNHFQWRNEFEKTFRARFGGAVAIPYKYLSFNIGVDFENITNIIYFDRDAMPQQYKGNIQALLAHGDINFHAWKFHLENKLAYQVTSNKEVLPLPEITLFSNFYYKDLFFKVLTFQLGVSVRYHSSYYAPNYMPATGQFYNQTETLIGNFPFTSAYINCHLKQVRFFVQAHNLIYTLLEDKNYFSMPNYPLTPTTFRFGLSWTFYD